MLWGRANGRPLRPAALTAVATKERALAACGLRCTDAGNRLTGDATGGAAVLGFARFGAPLTLPPLELTAGVCWGYECPPRSRSRRSPCGWIETPARSAIERLGEMVNDRSPGAPWQHSFVLLRVCDCFLLDITVCTVHTVRSSLLLSPCWQQKIYTACSYLFLYLCVQVCAHFSALLSHKTCPSCSFRFFSLRVPFACTAQCCALHVWVCCRCALGVPRRFVTLRSSFANHTPRRHAWADATSAQSVGSSWRNVCRPPTQTTVHTIHNVLLLCFTSVVRLRPSYTTHIVNPPVQWPPSQQAARGDLGDQRQRPLRCTR